MNFSKIYNFHSIYVILFINYKCKLSTENESNAYNINNKLLNNLDISNLFKIDKIIFNKNI